MPWQVYLILSIIFILILLCLLLFYIVKKELSFIFKGRCDRNENTLQDKPLTDFPNLNYTEISFKNLNETINGRIYFYNEIANKDIIIFCHGYGAGHEAYISEIDFFAKNNFVVVGFDYRGCKLSSGKLSHFGSSVVDTEACYNYLLNNNYLQNKKVYLVGHSWGAYTALCCSKLPKIEKVIALCPFNNPVDFFTKKCYFKEKFFTYILKPFRLLYLKLKYKKYGNISSYKTIDNSNKKALIIFGEQDLIIGKINYVFNNNVTKLSLADKGHNPYNTVEAEKYLNETITNLTLAENKQEFLQQVDYLKITQQDNVIMQTMLDFLK